MLHVLFLLHKLLADLEVHSGYVTWRDKTIAFIVLVSENLQVREENCCMLRSLGSSAMTFHIPKDLLGLERLGCFQTGFWRMGSCEATSVLLFMRDLSFWSLILKEFTNRYCHLRHCVLRNEYDQVHKVLNTSLLSFDSETYMTMSLKDVLQSLMSWFNWQFLFPFSCQFTETAERMLMDRVLGFMEKLKLT